MRRERAASKQESTDPGRSGPAAPRAQDGSGDGAASPGGTTRPAAAFPDVRRTPSGREPIRLRLADLSERSPEPEEGRLWTAAHLGDVLSAFAEDDPNSSPHPNAEDEEDLVGDDGGSAVKDGQRHRRFHTVGHRQPGTALVEFVRLIMVSLFAMAGWEVAAGLGSNSSARLVTGVGLGSGVGFVLGGVFGRRTASAVSHLEGEFRTTPASEVLTGGIGLIFGLVLATLLSLPLFHLPPKAAYPAVAFIYTTVGYVGYRTGRVKSDELFAVFGVKPRAAGGRAGEVSVLDASAILDGRILTLVRLGFLSGTLLVTRGVLEELQSVADSSSSSRRSRGKRALELLLQMKQDPAVDVVLVDDDPETLQAPVDARLVRLARSRGAALVTNDGNLAKVAAALDVPVRSIHQLADALRPHVVAGDIVAVPLSRRGRESGQAVGYLEDGTMVVVEQADHLLGHTVSVLVTNALQTSSGRLVFGRIAGSEDESGSLAEPSRPDTGPAGAV